MSKTKTSQKNLDNNISICSSNSNKYTIVVDKSFKQMSMQEIRKAINKRQKKILKSTSNLNQINNRTWQYTTAKNYCLRKNGAVDMQLNTRKVLQKKLLIISSQTSNQKIRTNDCSRQKFQANVNARDKANK